MPKTEQNEQGQVQLTREKQDQPALAQEQQEQQAQPVLAQEQQEQQAGQLLAANIAMQLPAAGNAVPPAAEQGAAPAPEITAPRTKAEKKLARQQQEELARQQALQRQEEAARRAEEAARRAEELRRLKAEDARIQRENRSKWRGQIFENVGLRTMLAEFLNLPAEEQTLAKAQTFLRAAGTHLLAENADLNAAYGGEATVNYAGSMIVPLKIVIATKVEDPELASDLLTRARELEATDAELAREHTLMALMEHDLVPSILDGEVALAPVLERAANELSEQFNLRLEGFVNVVKVFESVVARNLQLVPNDLTQEVNVLKSGSAYHSFARQGAVKEFERQVKTLMDTEHLDRIAAETRVLDEMREEQQEKEAHARMLTRGGAVVANVPDEQVKKYGCASFYQVLPKEQAAEVVKQSNGFLYMAEVPGEPDFAQLKPTLPETVTIKGEKIPLRRNYTLLVKALMQGVMDEHGALKEGALEFASEARDWLCDPAAAETMLKDNSNNHLDNFLSNYIRPGLVESLGNEDEAMKVLGQLYTLIRINTAGRGTIIPSEILNNFTSAISRIQAAGADAGPDAPNDNAPLAARQEQMRQAFLKENGGAPLTEAQNTQINALASLYADIDAAMTSMLEVRNMDVDSPDIPLPNACSANAAFILFIRATLMNQDAAGAFEYPTREQIKSAPLDYVNYCITHISELSPQNAPSFQSKLEKLQKMQAKLVAAQIAGQPLTLEKWESDLLDDLAISINNKFGGANGTLAKYEYHQAANLGQMEDGTYISLETFAAESSQYLVTPFTSHAAVGLYHGGKQATDAEYTRNLFNAKNALAAQEKQLAELTQQINQLTQQVDQLTQQIDQLAQHRHSNRQEIAQLEATLAAKKAELSDKNKLKASSSAIIQEERAKIHVAYDRASRPNGMIAYYNCDQALPDSDARLLARMKDQLASGTLPGTQPDETAG